MKLTISSASLLITVAFFLPTLVSAETWKELLTRADSLSNAQNNDSAIIIGRLALEKAEAEFDSKDTVVALVLFRLGRYKFDKAEYSEAEPLYKRALSIREEVLGPEHPDVAKVLNNLANLYWSQGKYAEVEELQKRALAIWEKVRGPEHPDVAASLNNLGILYDSQGKYVEAEQLYRRALAIWEKAFGGQHPNVAATLNSLGVLYFQQGKYAEAEPLHQRALAVWENTLGPDHPRLVLSLNNLGIVYYEQGKYTQAEPLYRRSLAILEKALGPDHPDVAFNLINLALVYYDQGKYGEAELLHKRALAIREKAFGPEHPDVALSLNNLGILYYAEGKYAEAEPLYQRALAIQEKAFGPEHPDVTPTLTNLGNLYYTQGKYAEAEPLYYRSLGISERALGPEHAAVALILNDLANLYRAQGKYAEADPLYRRVLAIREKALGQNHHFVAESLEDYSTSHRLQRNSGAALSMAERAVSIRRSNFLSNAPVLSEKDALTYSRYLRHSADNYLSCYDELESPDAPTVTMAADIILSGKGQVSDGIFGRQRSLVDETDSTTLALAESLRFTKFRLSKLSVEGPGEDAEAHRIELDSLSRLANELEAELSRHSASFRKQQDYNNITADRVATLLPENSILIEYLKYNYLQLKPDSSIPRYLAVVLAGKREPIITDLGEALEIDLLISQYREHLLAVSKADRMPAVVDQEDYRKISTRLYDKIWQPIENQVTDKELVFVAPDGALNMVSFAGLMGQDGGYLIERFAIHYLASGRDLIRLQGKSEPGHGLFALGDPDFGASAPIRMAGTPASKGITAAQAYYATRNVRSGCGSLKDLVVDPLPGTRREVERIAAEWTASTDEAATVYFGPEASEENFKAKAPGSRIIHLATHGYFIEGSCQPNQPKRGIDAEEGYVGENPLLLSGLLFAGSNLHGQGADSAQAEDGILTAYEVSATDLDGAELVVLSACETGLGEVKSGEGVYGLRRAFQMAGARTVVSALWPVSDRETAELMAKLYRSDKKNLAERMRQVQLDQLKALRAAGRIDHPFTWGGFIALGDWR